MNRIFLPKNTRKAPIDYQGQRIQLSRYSKTPRTNYGRLDIDKRSVSNQYRLNF